MRFQTLKLPFQLVVGGSVSTVIICEIMQYIILRDASRSEEEPN